MPRKQLPAEHLDYIRKHSTRPVSEIAAVVGLCDDTVRRIMMRENIRYFPGAKYVAKNDPRTWNRPCIRCKSTQSRPKFQYFCDPCSRRVERGTMDD